MSGYKLLLRRTKEGKMLPKVSWSGHCGGRRG